MTPESVLGLPPAWEQLIGHLHPSLVHFPIGLLLFALLCELLGLRRHGPRPSPTALACVVGGSLGAWAAGTAGWVLHETEGPETGLVTWHQYSGVALIALSTLAAVLALRGRSGERRGATEGYRFTLCFVSVLVGVTGHLGGSLTHGTRYLTGPLEQLIGWGDESPDAGGVTAQPAGSVSSAGSPSSGGAEGDGTAPGADAGAALPPVDFATQIRPLFDARCVECHNAEKTKGKLRLDVHPEDPDALVAGDPAASGIYQRISLPHDDFDIMPAKGDPLSAEQIALVERWIREGAPWPGAAPAPGNGEG